MEEKKSDWLNAANEDGTVPGPGEGVKGGSRERFIEAPRAQKFVHFTPLEEFDKENRGLPDKNRKHPLLHNEGKSQGSGSEIPVHAMANKTINEKRRPK